MHGVGPHRLWAASSDALYWLVERLIRDALSAATPVQRHHLKRDWNETCSCSVFAKILLLVSDSASLLFRLWLISLIARLKLKCRLLDYGARTGLGLSDQNLTADYSFKKVSIVRIWSSHSLKAWIFHLVFYFSSQKPSVAKHLT